MSFDIDFADKKTDIAIIGLSIRLPGVETVEQFWKHLKNGDEVVADLSALNSDLTPGPDAQIPFIKANNNIKGIEQFDASFFNFNLQEASWMDPQHRLFLELAWEALEAAGYTGEIGNSLAGVYAGVYASYYSMIHLLPNLNNARAATSLQMQIASEKDHVATMTAYKLGLTGPVLNIQAACSSSLAAVHMACESLLTYSADLMICGAATLSIPQMAGYEYQDNGLLSADGHLRAFDAGATGTLYSDGAGCVVLKRLQEAWEDGDTIYGVIKGSALNNDGSRKAGFTAPAAQGQIDVLERAMMAAGVQPEQISYLEAHGTGTPLGDAIELEALQEVFTRNTSKSAFCALGSAKSNFGHTGPAAGVIGLIKTVMALKEDLIPPAINIDMPNERLATGTSPFYLNPIPIEWCRGDTPRYAGVSSFGLGGTNVHVIVEEPPLHKPSTPVSKNRPLLYILSSKTETALNRYKERIISSLAYLDDNRLADAAYTLQTGRKAFVHRGFFVLGQADSAYLQNVSFYTGKVKDFLPSLHFYFESASDIQIPNPLLDRDRTGRVPDMPQFYEIWTEVWKQVQNAVNPAELSSEAKGSYDDIPGILDSFVMQITMSRLWKQWGILPDKYEGEGSGFYAAAAESGWLNLEDAAFLYVCHVYSNRSQAEHRLGLACCEERTSKLKIGTPPDSLLLAEHVRGLAAEQIIVHALAANPPLAGTRPTGPEIRLTVGINSALAGGGLQGTDLEPETGSAGMWTKVHHCLGRLWTEGYSINWAAYYEQETHSRIPLPTYPFERVKCWVEPAAEEQVSSGLITAAEPVRSTPHRLSAEQLTGYKAPKSGTERVLVHLWEKHLGVTPVGTQDNFYEMGGNSLLAASMNTELNELFQLQIGLEVFLEHQSIAELAETIESLFMEPIPLKGG